MPSSKNEDLLAKPYIPIDTDVVDNIEHYASDRIHVHIEYKDRDGSVRSMRGFIADVFTTENSEEYLKMVDGRSLRLDQLIHVEAKEDGKTFSTRDRSADLREKLDIEETRFFPNGIS